MVSLTDLRTKRVRKCYTMHECAVCLKTISCGETYHDGSKRAHVRCVARLIEAEVVHILSQSVALCRREGPPSAWPEQHIWVGVDDPISTFIDEKLCRTCRARKGI